MSKGFRPLVLGGTVVAGLLFASSLLHVSPKPLPLTRTGELRLPKPAYTVNSYDYSRDKVLRDLGVKQEVLVAAKESSVAAIQISDSAKKAQAQAVQMQAQKIQVASRSAAPAPKAKKSTTWNKSVAQAASWKAATNTGRSGAAAGSGLISIALSLQGVPYKWGGTTPAGFDCSGYVRYVFAEAGIGLPRDSYSQYRVGSSVANGDLSTGDLVFFNTDGPGASHVGIYLGGGRFIDSSNKGVAVQSLADGYWGRHYIGARRVGK